MESQTKRITYIDLLETLAILFVVAYHLALNPADGFLYRSPAVIVSYFTSTILSTCVPLFFFANGHLLLNRSFVLKKHVWKMLVIIALSAFWSIVTHVVDLLVRGDAFSVKTVLLNALNQKVTHFWYLSALIAIYALFPAFKALFDADKRAFAFVTAVIALMTFGFNLANNGIALLGVCIHRELPGLDFLAITRMNPFRTYGYAFVYFCLGGLAAHYKDRLTAISARKRNLIAIAALLAGCALLYGVGVLYTNYVDHESWDVVWNGYDTVFTAVNVLAIYTLSLNYTRDTALIRSVSKNTLGIYFLHPFVIWLVKPFLQKFGFLQNVPCNYLFAALIVLLCTAVCLGLRRIPALRRLVTV